MRGILASDELEAAIDEGFSWNFRRVQQLGQVFSDNEPSRFERGGTRCVGLDLAEERSQLLLSIGVVLPAGHITRQALPNQHGCPGAG